MSGQSVNMIRLKKLSIKYKFKIIEDASHALGSTYKNKPQLADETNETAEVQR